MTETDDYTRLRQDAFERTGVAPAQWSVVESRAVQWRDTSLGVPQPGHFYGRVMVPGQRVVLRADVATGSRALVYHTSFSGSFVFSREMRVADLGRGIA